MDQAKKTHKLLEGWKFRASDEPNPANSNSNEWENSQPLPTTIYLDLLANHAIPDPFFSKNEELVQWVATKTWIYETTFTVPAEPQKRPNQKVVLVFEGLDTYTTVELDGETILETDNMFLSHRVDITKQLRYTHMTKETVVHTLRITFHNTEKRAEEEIDKHPEHSWLGLAFGNKRLAARKAQYHFGWDWGPVLTDCGPWKPIYLEIYHTRLVDIEVRTNIKVDHSVADLDILIEVEGKASHARIEIETGDNKVASCLVTLGGARTSTTIQLQDPKLWWPWTLGDPTLYTAKVALLSRSDSGTEELLDILQKKFGIRKVELVRQPLIDQEGSSFFFRVNDTPLFAAGSCWIPIDSFAAQKDPEKYHKWMRLAKDSNQVMVRVWGGGIYEHDAFFDACDELGLLVWHDFMFACGLYPAHSSFEESVMAEVRQNLTRLRHHPSIAIWCGNNEDYGVAYMAQRMAGEGKYDPAEMNLDKIRQSGFPARVFYEILLPDVCKKLIPDIPYWPGSPFGGDFFNSLTEGDIHQWRVWHFDKFPYQDFPQLSGRMVTEFGLESVPHWKTVKKYYYPTDRNISPDDHGDYTEDEYMVWHNKATEGQETMKKYGVDNIPFDDHSLRGYIYCSQLIQSEALSAAFLGWRRLWQGPGREYCAGALVWQLNDCWPVSSWAIADYEMRPKLSYWAVKRANQPITAGIARVLKDDSLEVEAWACNMALKPICVAYQIQAWHVKTGQKVWSHTVSTPVQLKPNRSTELEKVGMSPTALSGEGQTGWKDLALAIQLFSIPESPVADLIAASTQIARFVNFHQPLKEVPLAAKVTMSVRLTKGETSSILEISTSAPMKCVNLDFEEDDEIELSDNGFDLIPEETFRVSIAGLKGSNEKKLRIYWLAEIGWQSQEVVCLVKPAEKL